VKLDNGGEVVLAAPHVDVLIDGDVVKRPKPISWPLAIMMVLSSGLDEPRTM